MHSFLLSMGMTKFCLTEPKENTTVWYIFIRELENIAMDIYNRKQSHRFFRNNPPVPKESVNDCWICHKPFENDQESFR